MRVGHLLPGRADWYDRTPTAVPSGAWFQQVGPAALANIWSYTVPVGRKGWVGNVSAAVLTVGVPTASGRNAAEIIVNPSGLPIMLAQAIHYSGVVGTVERDQAAVSWILGAGAQIIGRYEIGNVGHFVEVHMTALITEFDA